MKIISLLETLVPWIISLASIIVAGVSIRTNKHMAYRQAFFDHKARAFELFYEAFANLAFDQFNPEKRAALTNAAYCAMLFSSLESAKGLEFVANRAMSAKDYDGIAALEEIMPDLRDHLSQDLSNTWTAPIQTLRENFVVSKKKNSHGG